MSIYEYSQAYEFAHIAICDRTHYAKLKHPEDLSPLERLDTILSELNEVRDELERGDYARAMDEFKDVGAALYRAMEELSRNEKVKI